MCTKKFAPILILQICARSTPNMLRFFLLLPPPPPHPKNGLTPLMCDSHFTWRFRYCTHATNPTSIWVKNVTLVIMHSFSILWSFVLTFSLRATGTLHGACTTGHALGFSLRVCLPGIHSIPSKTCFYFFFSFSTCILVVTPSPTSFTLIKLRVSHIATTVSSLSSPSQGVLHTFSDFPSTEHSISQPFPYLWEAFYWKTMNSISKYS